MMGELTPAQGSALSLLLRHGQGYDDVGRRLGISPLAFRARAHEAVALLVGLDPVTVADGMLIDRALGQLSPAEDEADLAGLDENDRARRQEVLAEALDAFLGPQFRPAESPARSEPAVAPLSVPQLSPAAGPVILATPRGRRSPRPAMPVRMGVMFALGLAFLAAGGVLFANGAH